MLIAISIAMALYIVFDIWMERNMNRRVEVLESVVASLLIEMDEIEFEFEED
jgi:polyphosphate kinase